MYSDGLGFRVDDSHLRGHWFESPLEQCLLKIKAVKSVPENGNMTGKIPQGGNRKTAGKNPVRWKFLFRGKKLSSGAWNFNYCGIRRICRDFSPPFVSV